MHSDNKSNYSKYVAQSKLWKQQLTNLFINICIITRKFYFTSTASFSKGKIFCSGNVANTFLDKKKRRINTSSVKYTIDINSLIVLEDNINL